MGCINLKTRFNINCFKRFSCTLHGLRQDIQTFFVPRKHNCLKKNIGLPDNDKSAHQLCVYLNSSFLQVRFKWTRLVDGPFRTGYAMVTVRDSFFVFGGKDNTGFSVFKNIMLFSFCS
jgi:hypothetical protein